MKRLMILGLIALLGARDPATARPTQSERAFAATMIRQIKTTHPDLVIKPTDDPLSVTLSGGTVGDATVNFHNIYAYCRQATAADCKSQRRSFLEDMLSTTPDPTVASLRVAVRDKVYVDAAREMLKGGKSGKAAIVARPIGDDLFAIIVSDSSRKIALINDETLQTLKLSPAQAWRLAWRQTRAALPALPTATQLQKSAVVFQDQEYLASLLVDLEGWAPVAAAAGPDLFVTAVADGFVFVGKMPDGAALAKFRQSAREDCDAQPRCVSPHVYRFRDGHWVVSR